MSDEDWQDFLQDVKPLKQEKKVSLRQKIKQGDFEEARDSASTFKHKDTNPLVTDIIHWVEPTDIIGYKMPGIQEGVYRRLRLGKYPIQARLDLHRKTIKEARNLVLKYINNCHKSGLRSVLLCHGKGGHTEGESGDLLGKAQMKSFCAQWLKQIDLVTAYHSAQPQDGGAGALYVMLRKNAEQKQRTRDMFR